jgi:hypothetical protein
VLSNAPAYLSWRADVIRRLQHLYPRDDLDRLGDVVPRQAYETTRPFNAKETPRLISEWLASARSSSNRFLNPRDEMIKNGFRGSPYRFSLEEDRANREP